MFFLIKNVSAEKGPVIFNFSDLNCLMAGIISFCSSPFFSIVSQWGFRPSTAIFGFLFIFLIKKLFIDLTFLMIFYLLMFFETYFIGKCVVIGETDSFLL